MLMHCKDILRAADCWEIDAKFSGWVGKKSSRFLTQVPESGLCGAFSVIYQHLHPINLDSGSLAMHKKLNRSIGYKTSFQSKKVIKTTTWDPLKKVRFLHLRIDLAPCHVLTKTFISFQMMLMHCKDTLRYADCWEIEAKFSGWVGKKSSRFLTQVPESGLCGAFSVIYQNLHPISLDSGSLAMHVNIVQVYRIKKRRFHKKSYQNNHLRSTEKVRFPHLRIDLAPCHVLTKTFSSFQMMLMHCMDTLRYADCWEIDAKFSGWVGKKSSSFLTQVPESGLCGAFSVIY